MEFCTLTLINSSSLRKNEKKKNKSPEENKEKKKEHCIFKKEKTRVSTNTKKCAKKNKFGCFFRFI